jgi:hypothetical protein
MPRGWLAGGSNAVTPLGLLENPRLALHTAGILRAEGALAVFMG